MAKKILMGPLTLVIALVSLALTGVALTSLLLSSGDAEGTAQGDAVDVAILDRYDMYITNQVSSALEGVLSIDKVYWLSDDDQVAPEPDQQRFGAAEDPSTLGWLLEEAQPLLDGQQTLFSAETPLMQGMPVNYYLDDTILAITWKQVINDTVYTISEVKLAHPSQFRRFLAGGAYGSEIQLTTTEMAASVNAVVASSGDFYAFRRLGVVVYDGVVQRVNSRDVDTCYIDDQGNLLFSYRGELPDAASAQAFVDENNVRFSLAFGPVLVDRGESMDFSGYILGEVDNNYARAALCQMGPLHYLVVTANIEKTFRHVPTVYEFQQIIASFGCEMAYALDGGQTAAIVMNDKLINRVVYGSQRDVSDIIYFATAIPDGE